MEKGGIGGRRKRMEREEEEDEAAAKRRKKSKKKNGDIKRVSGRKKRRLRNLSRRGRSRRSKM